MKFLVTSCYPDERQVFWDFVEAPNAGAAEQIVAGARDYATVADVMDAKDLREVASALESAADVPASAFALAWSLEGEDGALLVGTPEQLSDWAREPVEAGERARRQAMVDGELADRAADEQEFHGGLPRVSVTMYLTD
jgi:hypothetical protein